MRNYSFFDHLCLGTDHFLRSLAGQKMPSPQMRPSPATDINNSSPLSPEEKKHVAGLIRVNYAGEVCAQALYQGQALTARKKDLQKKLQQAAIEEQDHLYWCQYRLQSLNSRVSYLNPVWYFGALALGLIAGWCGDQWNLGFLAETEKQVTQHLNTHLQQLPLQDDETRAILTQMRDEEAEHALTAEEAGATPLPFLLACAMRFTSKIMTTIAYWI